VSVKPVGITPHETVAQVASLVKKFDWRHIGQFRDEAISQGNLAYWRALAKGQKPAYAYTCARNQVLKVVRDSLRISKRFVLHDRDGADFPVEAVDAERWRLVQKTLAVSIRDLPKIAQACMGLHILRGLPASGIASVLHLDETRVRRILRVSKKKIRRDVEVACRRL
jgi:DNA-directed RNA polymerase specialized sigma24 family protein